MKISVIVPVYNVEKYVKKCIQSIKDQSLEDFECLVVDDGSQDNSINIVKELINNDNRFTILTKQNGGLSDARNYGLQFAKGEYVCFVDSDDYVDKDLLKLTYEKAIKHNSDIVCFDLYYESGYDLKVSKGAYFEEVSSYKEDKDIIFNNNSANNKLFKRKFLKGKQFIKDMWYEDMAVVPVWIAEANNMSYVNNPLYFYVQRDGSITHTANEKLFDIYKSIDIVKDKLGLTSQQVKDLYFHNCLIMTTLKIKNIENKKERRAFYLKNIDLLNTNYPSWFQDIKYSNYPVKYKIVFFLLKYKLVFLLDVVYKI